MLFQIFFSQSTAHIQTNLSYCLVNNNLNILELKTIFVGIFRFLHVISWCISDKVIGLYVNWPKVLQKYSKGETEKNALYLIFNCGNLLGKA